MDRGARDPKTDARVTTLVTASDERRAASLEAMLRGLPGLRVIPADLAALAALIDRHEPGLLVLAAPTPRVVAALEHLSELPRAPAVIVLTSEPHDVWTPRARRAGVRAVLRDDASAAELAVATAATTAGLLLLHPDALRGSPRARPAARDAPEMNLTPREHEILERMAEGMSNRTIARRLSISRFTVKFHVASILAKLGAGSRTEAVTLGVRHGLITL